MTKRLELHERLCQILGSDHVYFQPPETIKMVYPCIRYKFSRVGNVAADNIKYLMHRQYEVTLIHKNPDNTVWNDILEKFEHSELNTTYTKDGLNHYVFTIYI